MSIKKKTILAVIGVLLAFVVVAGSFFAVQAAKVGAIFAANDALKSEGYYLSEFEFEMLSVSYYLDKGRYRDGLRRLNEMHRKLVRREGLIKVPEFADARARLEFYLDRQNPETGAFYPNGDDPVLAYAGVTANMINLIEDLSRQAGEPFRLKHPLRFLERVDTPEEMTATLDDAGRVGFVGTKLKPLFVSAIELNDLLEQCEQLAIYPFPADARTAFLRWFYDNQDAETGLWGPRDRSTGAMIDGGDIGDSGKVIKLFVDGNGDDLRPEFPLRYADRIFASAIERLSAPLPSRLDEMHRWIIDRDRGFRFLTKYVWSHGREDDHETVRALLRDFVTLRFERFFVPADGAFSLYPDSGGANLDGTSEAAGMLDYIGALSADRQSALWGDPADLGTVRVAALNATAIEPLAGKADINAIRFYAADPQSDYLGKVAAIHYPRPTPVLDMVELVPAMEHWLDTTDQMMGNWGSKDGIGERLSAVTVDPAPVIEAGGLDQLLRENGRLVAVGFDVLQAPRYRLAIEPE
ncbi:hypothetical protein [Oricola sp.]|uniref:hypothetical protein n=1 Tax=Oricola sp. TaxID=1979950 RepID=UPI0025CE00B2|nr:hypothetical protein [Oricola sp.]MCI5073478.1 hypothetical protein [Oricola sp.]